MIINSKLEFVTYIPVRGEKSVLITPTVNNISKDVYDKIKNEIVFKEYVDAGLITVVGRPEKNKVESNDLFEGNEELTADESDDYVGTIKSLKTAEAVEIIKNTVVKKDLEDALAKEKRTKVKKALRDQLKSIEIKSTEEDEEEKKEHKGMFVD